MSVVSTIASLAETPARAPIRHRLAKAGLLSLLLLGVLVTPLWMAGLAWSLYRVALWLVG